MSPRGNGIEETSDIDLIPIETGVCETETERWEVKYKTKPSVPGREGSRHLGRAMEARTPRGPGEVHTSRA